MRALFQRVGKKWTVSLVIFMLAGCGVRLWKGGDNPPSLLSNGGVASLMIRVIWPQTTPSNGGRLIPSTAQSIVVRLLQADYNGNEKEIARTIPPIQRPQSTYKFTNIPPGLTTIEATAYPNPDGTGTPVAKGAVDCTLIPGENQAPALVMDSTIKVVEVTPNPATISVGEKLQMTATAKDEAGNIVMVPEGGFSWASSNPGVASVDSNGLVTGLAEGSAVITATEKESGKSGSADISVSKVITFERTFGGAGWDGGYSVQETRDGGFIITGETDSFGAWSLETDVYLIKTDSQGNKLWEKTFGGGLVYCGYSVQETRDGGFIIAGKAIPSGEVWYDVYLIRTDSQGNKLWEKTFGDWDDDRGYSVQETSDGGFIITGRTEYFGGGGDVYLIKTDAQGNKLWERTFGGGVVDCGYSVQETRDGGYIIAGATSSFGAGGSDVYLIKTDSQGNKLWERTFGGGSDDWGYSVQETRDGGYIIAGATSSFGAGGSDVYLIKTDSQGNELWERTFGGGGEECGYSVHETRDGGFIIAGWTDSFGAGGADVYLIKTDSQGLVSNKGRLSLSGKSINNARKEFKNGNSRRQPHDFPPFSKGCSFPK